MGQRNITSQMMDLEMDQRGPNYILPEPCVILGGVTTYPQPDLQTIARASSNPSNLDAPMFYGMPPYHGVHHHQPHHLHHHPNHSLDLGMGPAPNFYVPYMATPDQLQPSSNFGVIGVSPDEYARNGHFMEMDNMRGSYKRKNAEGIPGGFNYFNNGPSSSNSSVGAPMITARHPDGVAPMEALYLPLPQYRGSGAPSIGEVESQRSVRNRLGANAMDPVLAHNHNPLVQGNFVGPPFQPTGAIWIDQSSDSGSGGAAVWNQTPSAIPYMHGSSVSGANMEARNIALQHYPETSGNRNSSAFMHPPSSVNIRHHAVHHPPPPPPPVPGVRSHSMNVLPQVPANSSFRVPSSYPAQNGMDMMPRHVGPVLPSGLRIYHSSGALPPDATFRQRNFPHLRFMPTDGVAILEIPEFYEVGNYVDHHRDMRLDIEDMSYEELLALGERIGNVNTGLSEETISSKLKTRTFRSTTAINLEEPASSADQETDSCIVCQEEYKNHEKLGTLDCGHEYHEECLKKWLFVKNVCPVCKSEALAGNKKD